MSEIDTRHIGNILLADLDEQKVMYTRADGRVTTSNGFATRNGNLRELITYPERYHLSAARQKSANPNHIGCAEDCTCGDQR